MSFADLLQVEQLLLRARDDCVVGNKGEALQIGLEIDMRLVGGAALFATALGAPTARRLVKAEHDS